MKYLIIWIQVYSTEIIIQNFLQYSNLRESDWSPKPWLNPNEKKGHNTTDPHTHPLPPPQTSRLSLASSERSGDWSSLLQNWSIE